MNRRLLAGLAVVMGVALGVEARASDWETDYAKASASASKSGSYMLLDFSGSDWCGWCIRLDQEVFSKPAFRKYAKENLVCVSVDFPRKKELAKTLKEQNAELAKKYAIQGFPTVVVLSPEGELVGTTGYKEGGPQKYVESLKEMIAGYEAQHPKKAAGKKPAAVKPGANGAK